MTDKQLKVLCIGDSITGWADLSKYMKFSNVLELMIGVRVGFDAVTMTNKGIGGDTTQGVRERFHADVLQQQPDIVIMLIGGNDVARSFPQQQTRDNLNFMYSELKNANIRTLAMLYHVLPNPKNPATAWDTLDDNNQLIAETAKQYGIEILDMGSLMKDATKIYKYEELVNLNDGVHLNPGGELVFAKAIFNKLVELGWI
ncbi:MAG: SGNH/GDSL hydrolase family protein [bacterium]